MDLDSSLRDKEVKPFSNGWRLRGSPISLQENCSKATGNLQYDNPRAPSNQWGPRRCWMSCGGVLMQPLPLPHGLLTPPGRLPPPPL